MDNEIAIPRIAYFVDETGVRVEISAYGINVRLKKDGTHEYYQSYGFGGVVMLTPIYDIGQIDRIKEIDEMIDDKISEIIMLRKLKEKI